MAAKKLNLILCWLGIHRYKVIDISFGFGISGSVKTIQCKICGLKNIESIICCENNSVDFFGMIFYKKSPRNITLNQAKELTNISKEFKIKPVGVFVDHNIYELKKIIL